MTEVPSHPDEELARLREQVARLEEDLARLSDEKRKHVERESRLLQILDLVPDFIFAVDWDGRILRANKTMADAYGMSVEEVRGKLVEEIAPHPEQARRLLADHRQVMESGEPNFTPEETVVDAEGNQRIVQIHRIPYVEAETGRPAVIGVGSDITDRKQNEESVLRNRDAVIFGMAKLAESRDEETGQHLERICKYVEILARHLSGQYEEIDEDWIHTITTTAALHDIGKVGIPDAVLQKKGRLTEGEYQVIKKHTHIGGDTLLALKRRWGDDPFLVTAAQIAMSHHEKWDGNGYPFGLVGDNIPLAARIVAVADVYDALTSKRVYKDAMPHEQAKAIIVDGEGEHFDPAVVDAFVKVAEVFREIAARHAE
jgi:PAS domain S-box-containing protein